MRATPRDRYEHEQFVLRPWESSDSRAMSEAITGSYEHLRPWHDWATPDQDPATAEDVIDGFRRGWREQSDFVIGIFSPDERIALGGTGFHLRGGTLGDQAEIGMWVRADRAGAGLGTTALGAMLDWGFGGWRWRRIIWRCDVENAASRRVAEKCGMRLEGTFREDVRGPDRRLRDTLQFAMLAREHRERDLRPVSAPRSPPTS